MSGQAALATHELTKDYAVGFWRKRPYRALDRLTLEVRAGEVFGFLGPNGAGKTTTLKLLMQLVFPTSGRAEILGGPVGDLRVKRRIGFVVRRRSSIMFRSSAAFSKSSRVAALLISSSRAWTISRE